MGSKSLLKSSLVFSLGMLLGRLSGLVREYVVANIYGVGSEADIAILTLTYPDLVVTLISGGVTHLVLIPRLQKEKNLNFQKAAFFKYSVLLFILFSFISLALSLLSPLVTQLLAPGLKQPNFDTASKALLFASLAIPVLGITSVTRAWLLKKSSIGIISIENLLNNTVVILGLIILTPLYGLKGLLFSIFLGALFRWGTQLIPTLKETWSGLSYTKQIKVLDKSLFYDFTQALSAATLLVLLPIIARSFSSYSGEGAIATFNYAYKYIEFPFNIGIYTVSFLIFPTLTQSFQTSISSAVEISKKALDLILIIALPLTIYLIWFTYTLIVNKVEFLDISQDNIMTLYWLSLIGFLFLPFRGVSSLSLTIFSANQEFKIPFYINLVGIFICFAFSWPLTRSYGILGAMLAYNLSYIFIFICELFFIERKYKISLKNNFFHLNFLKILLISLLPLVIYSLLIKINESTLINFSAAFILGLISLVANIYFNQPIKKFLLDKF